MQALLCTHCNPAWHRGCQLRLTSHTQVIQLSLLQRGFEPLLCYLLLILHWKTTDQHTRKKNFNHSSQSKRSKQIHKKRQEEYSFPKLIQFVFGLSFVSNYPHQEATFEKEVLNTSVESTWFYQQRECPAICPVHSSDCFLSGVELAPLWELRASTMTEESYSLLNASACSLLHRTPALILK